MQPWQILAVVFTFLAMLATILQYQDEWLHRALEKQEQRIDRLTCIVIPQTCRALGEDYGSE